MKTKLTFLMIAIAALVGVGMLMAFKNDAENKKYLIMRTYISVSDSYLITINENGEIEEVGLKSFPMGGAFTSYAKNDKANCVSVTKKMNELSQKGYRLIQTSTTTGQVLLGEYIFEKE